MTRRHGQHGRHDCDACRELLGAWIDQALEGAERARVELHLVDCVACQAELAALAAVDRALSSLETPRVPDRDWSEVAARAWERAAAAGEAPVATGMESPPASRPEKRDEQGGRQADWGDRLRAWLGLEGSWWRGLAPVMGVFLVALLSWQVWTGRLDGSGSRATTPQVAPAPVGRRMPVGGDTPAAHDPIEVLNRAGDGVAEAVDEAIGESLEESHEDGRVLAPRLVQAANDDAAVDASAEAPGDAPRGFANWAEQSSPTSSPEGRSVPDAAANATAPQGTTLNAFQPPREPEKEAPIPDQEFEEVDVQPLTPPVSPGRSKKVEPAESKVELAGSSVEPAESSPAVPAIARRLEATALRAGRGTSAPGQETWRVRSASSFESTTNPLGLLLEGAPPARLLEAHLDAGPQLPELIDAAALLRAEEHAAASALLDDLLAGTTDAAEIRSDALRVDDATLRVRARARYLLLVAGHGAGSPDDLAGLRRRMAETEQVADEFARYTEGRQARLWSAEIAYRIWTLTGEREDCRNAERSLRATIARLENDPALTGHLDTLLSGLDC